MPDAKTYLSSYTDGLVTAPQFLAEQMCARLAAHEGVTLGWRFWREPRWAKIFRRQVAEAARLMGEYPAGEVIAAMQDRRARNIHSLGLRSEIVPLLRERLRASETVAPSGVPDVLPSVTEAPRPTFGRKDPLARLRELD